MRWAVLALFLLSGAAMAQTASDHLTLCATPPSEPSCKVNRAQFHKEFPQAYRGDYQSQRNIAFCLRDGCDGSVKRNPALACAWRMVVLLSGSSRVDTTDQTAFKIDCGHLDDAALETAKAQASAISSKIRERRR